MTQQQLVENLPALSSLVGQIAALLAGGAVLNAGDVAGLRRMDPRRPTAGFFKLEGAVLDEHLPGDEGALADRETRWAAIASGLAHLGALHQPGRRLGQALAASGYSDLRFVRLARADVDRLVDELPSLARFFSAKRVAVDWTDAARLILSAGGQREEGVRRALARDFYGSLARTGDSSK